MAPIYQAVFDSPTSSRWGQATLPAYQLLKPYIAYVHVKDAQWGSGTVVPPGQGDGDLPAILGDLLQTGWKGFLSPGAPPHRLRRPGRPGARPPKARLRLRRQVRLEAGPGLPQRNPVRHPPGKGGACNMEHFRVGLVGCGGIGQVHGAVLRDLEGVDLAGLRRHPARAPPMTFAEPSAAPPTTPWRPCWTRSAWTASTSAPPTTSTPPWPAWPRKKGIHVFTEKPPVMDRAQWADFQALEHAPVRCGRVLQNRYNASVQLLRRLLDSGRPGSSWGPVPSSPGSGRPPITPRAAGRGSLATEGGGVLINQSIHTMDLLVQFLGRPRQVEASIANHHLKGVIEVEGHHGKPISISAAPPPCSTPPPPTAQLPRAGGAGV